MFKEEFEVLSRTLNELSEEREKINALYLNVLERIKEVSEREATRLAPQVQNEVNHSVEKTMNTVTAKPSFDQKQSGRPNNNRGNNRGKNRLEDVREKVVKVLKNNEQPMKIDEILAKVNKETKGEKISARNFRNNMLPRVIGSTNEIQRVERGLYTYRENA